jgi:ferredoxin, 2Fe-2S
MAGELHIRDRDGTEHRIEGSEGWSVMEILREAGLPIAAICNGAMACATCHVYVLGGPSPGSASEDELSLLDTEPAFDPERSRLACQIQYTRSLAGLELELAPAG